METKIHSTFWIKGLSWFLAISFLFTILSRAADSFTVARVTVCPPTARKIQHSLTAEGKIGKNREISVNTQPDILVRTILVNEGQKVAKGDVLAVLDPEDLEKSAAELRNERTALELQNQAVRSSQNLERKKRHQAIQRAKADYKWLQKQNKKELRQAETALKKRQKALKNAKPDTIASLKENIANDKKHLAELQKTARTEEQNAKRALEDAMITPADDNTIQINNLSIQKLDQQIDKLSSLQKQKGEILSPADGIITGILVNTGQKTTDTGIFTMTDEAAGLKFVGQITPEEAELVSVGNTVSLKNADQETEVPITSLEQNEDQDCMIMTALLPAGMFSLGDTVTASVIQESEIYPCTVPLTAIYDENGKKYILYLEKENTVLGEQETARKTEVQIIEQNDRYAALESETIQKDSQIITDTDRLVKAGDRIRLTEN